MKPQITTTLSNSKSSKKVNNQTSVLTDKKAAQRIDPSQSSLVKSKNKQEPKPSANNTKSKKTKENSSKQQVANDQILRQNNREQPSHSPLQIGRKRIGQAAQLQKQVMEAAKENQSDQDDISKRTFVRIKRRDPLQAQTNDNQSKTSESQPGRFKLVGSFGQSNLDQPTNEQKQPFNFVRLQVNTDHKQNQEENDPKLQSRASKSKPQDSEQDKPKPKLSQGSKRSSLGSLKKQVIIQAQDDHSAPLIQRVSMNDRNLVEFNPCCSSQTAQALQRKKATLSQEDEMILNAPKSLFQHADNKSFNSWNKNSQVNESPNTQNVPPLNSQASLVSNVWLANSQNNNKVVNFGSVSFNKDKTNTALTFNFNSASNANKQQTSNNPFLNQSNSESKPVFVPTNPFANAFSTDQEKQNPFLNAGEQLKVKQSAMFSTIGQQSLWNSSNVHDKEQQWKEDEQARQQREQEQALDNIMQKKTKTIGDWEKVYQKSIEKLEVSGSIKDNGFLSVERNVKNDQLMLVFRIPSGKVTFNGNILQTSKEKTLCESESQGYKMKVRVFKLEQKQQTKTEESSSANEKTDQDKQPIEYKYVNHDVIISFVNEDDLIDFRSVFIEQLIDLTSRRLVDIKSQQTHDQEREKHHQTIEELQSRLDKLTTN